MFRVANFEGAVFTELIDLSDAVFDKALFRGATFEQGASFSGAEFTEMARFERTNFARWVSFRDAVFNCPAVFEHPESEEDEHEAGGEWQHEVTFGGWADFRRARFTRGAGFGGATFERRARFAAATFGSVKHPAGGSFEGARFVRARTFGPVLVHGRLVLDRAAFEAPVRVEISARELSCERAHFLSRTTLELRHATVNLEDAEFGQPSVIAGARNPFPLGDARRRGGPAHLDDTDVAAGRPNPAPRIWSLHRANVENLSIANADLERCFLSRAYNLDRLRFGEGDKIFRQDRRFRTRRLMIHEERLLRGEAERTETDPEVATAEQIARAYRALRKGREDNRNEPGAADFYYGEMEMRRRLARKGEWAILMLYWLVSGYALRAWRAVAALAVTAALVAWGLEAWGFKPDQGYWNSLLFSLESTSSLFRGQTVVKASTLEPFGHALQLGMRLLGPLLLGLAILAVRGRVKR